MCTRVNRCSTFVRGGVAPWFEPAGTQLYDYEIFNLTHVAFYCTLLLPWVMHQKFNFTIQLDVYSRKRMATTRARGY